MTGNCLKGSRPLLSFDDCFNLPHYSVIKELLIQTFGTPQHHPKSQPFFDHVFAFYVINDRIYFRNFQIIEEDGQLAEIGPRFVLNPIKIFAGSFGGESLWANPNYITPNFYRKQLRLENSMKYLNQKYQKEKRQRTTPKVPFVMDPTNEIFKTKAPEQAVGAEKKLFIRKKK